LPGRDVALSRAAPRAIRAGSPARRARRPLVGRRRGGVSLAGSWRARGAAVALPVSARLRADEPMVLPRRRRASAFLRSTHVLDLGRSRRAPGKGVPPWALLSPPGADFGGAVPLALGPDPGPGCPPRHPARLRHARGDPPVAG